MSVIQQIFANYKLTDIIILLLLIGFGIKEVVQLRDWFKARIKSDVAASSQNEVVIKRLDKLESKISEYKSLSLAEFKEIKSTLETYHDKLKVLIDSDRDDIKADIVKQHHYFKKLGYVDDHSLDTIERRYVHYCDEGGNSYISDLMEQLRDLPSEPALDKE